LDINNKSKKIRKRSKEGSLQLKQDILSVAERCFKAYGYEKTTLQMIAEELHITQGAINYHYKNKYMVLYDLFERLYDSQFEYVNAHPPDELNAYLLVCIAYLHAFSEVMKRQRSWELFFQKDQFNYWVSGKRKRIEENYRNITADFHKSFTADELRAAAITEVGAVMRLYEFFKKGDFTAEKFCYHVPYLVGVLSKLDEMTIQKDMARAYEYVDSHDMPTIFLLE